VEGGGGGWVWWAWRRDTHSRVRIGRDVVGSGRPVSSSLGKQWFEMDRRERRRPCPHTYVLYFVAGTHTSLWSVSRATGCGLGGNRRWTSLEDRCRVGKAKQERRNKEKGPNASVYFEMATQRAVTVRGTSPPAMGRHTRCAASQGGWKEGALGGESGVDQGCSERKSRG
jgi:hypothetical protein